MDALIIYCGSWGYEPKAVSLAAQLKAELKLDAMLEVGSGGVFDVFVDSRLVYSKKETGNFPDEQHLIEALRWFSGNRDGFGLSGEAIVLQIVLLVFVWVGFKRTLIINVNVGRLVTRKACYGTAKSLNHK